MNDHVVSGFPPHFSVHFELPCSWKYSPIVGLIGGVVSAGGDDVAAGIGEGFASASCNPVDAVVDGLMMMNGVHSTLGTACC